MRFTARRIDERYRVSPLVLFEDAVDTAVALRDLECTDGTISYELRAKYGFLRPTCDAVLREATSRSRSRLVSSPRMVRHLPHVTHRPTL